MNSCSTKCFAKEIFLINIDKIINAYALRCCSNQYKVSRKFESICGIEKKLLPIAFAQQVFKTINISIL